MAYQLPTCWIVNNQIDPFIDTERTVVEVGAANVGLHAIHNPNFRVHERRLIFVDFDPTEQKWRKTATASRVDRHMIAYSGSKNHHPHTSSHSVNQGVGDACVGQKIGVGDVDGFLC
jgi:hypothetical protein